MNWAEKCRACGKRRGDHYTDDCIVHCYERKERETHPHKRTAFISMPTKAIPVLTTDDIKAKISRIADEAHSGDTSYAARLDTEADIKELINEIILDIVAEVEDKYKERDVTFRVEFNALT
jgi:hypothetical protein